MRAMLCPNHENPYNSPAVLPIVACEKGAMGGFMSSQGAICIFHVQLFGMQSWQNRRGIIVCVAMLRFAVFTFNAFRLMRAMLCPNHKTPLILVLILVLVLVVLVLVLVLVLVVVVSISTSTSGSSGY